MSERSYEGKLIDDKNGFEVIISDTFNYAKIEIGNDGQYVMCQFELEQLARWILKIQPYGYKSLSS